jgi:outer membrane protein insertion porin family
MDLDYFSDVKFTIAPGSASDKAIVTASVVEKATGTVSIGLKPHAAPAVQLALSELNLLGRGYDLVAKTEFALKGTETEVSFTDPYWLDQNLPAKWGVSLSTGSADSWTTPIVGFQLTLWAGVLVFPIPIVLLILLRGAYKSYALTGNPARQVREYRKTMQAVKIAVTLQVCYVIATQGVHYMLSKTDVAMYASHFVCD